jgi:hypothetical protein
MLKTQKFKLPTISVNKNKESISKELDLPYFRTESNLSITETKPSKKEFIYLTERVSNTSSSICNEEKKFQLKKSFYPKFPEKIRKNYYKYRLLTKVS